MFQLPCFLSDSLRSGPCRRHTATLAATALLAVLCLSPAKILAASDADQPSPPIVAVSPGHLESHAPVQVTPVLADWLDVMLNPLVSFIHSRQRLIQVGALMMILALIIIWWRK